jgi:hypothetical protein
VGHVAPVGHVTTSNAALLLGPGPRCFDHAWFDDATALWLMFLSPHALWVQPRMHVMVTVLVMFTPSP